MGRTGRTGPRDKVALVTGITGQDGQYLAEALLAKGYLVHGLSRGGTAPPGSRDRNFARLQAEAGDRLVVHTGDLTDPNGVGRLVRDCRPDEIYNLAAQSSVEVSFGAPDATAAVNAIGVLRLLEAVRGARLEDHTRLYQASTSEMFGLAETAPQTEATPFRPRSPYAIAKAFAFWTVVNHREAYGLHASNGILFNHESPLRGETYVTRKITRAVAAAARGETRPLALGNLDACRDWGHARDYVAGIWRMLQEPVADDYVLATGVATSVRRFVDLAYAEIGVEIVWRGHGVDEQGLDRASGRVLVTVDPRFFRPTEVHGLVGDPSKARHRLGWTATTDLATLVREMVAAELAAEPADVGTRPVAVG